MKHLLLGALSVSVISMVPVQQAEAHVAYYDLFNNPSTVISTTGATTYYTGNSEVHGNYGWADAMDADWGDSHKGSWISFSITDPAGAWVDITVQSDGVTEYSPIVQDVAVRVGDLTPAFSLYAGTVPDESHDGATADLPSQLGREGAWRALKNTTMGNDLGEIATIQYLAHAGEVDGLVSSVSLNNFFLEQGIYSLVVGGTCYLRDRCGAFNPLDADETARGYDVMMSVTSVPLPATAWMMLTGLLGVMGLKKRQSPCKP